MEIVRAQQDNSDTQLLEMARAGDNNAFGTLVTRHTPRIAATVIGMLGDNDAADDVGQEVFIRFFRSMDSFNGQSELSTYLIRIAINLSINEIKRQKRKHTVSLDNNMVNGPEQDDTVNSPENRDLKELLDKAIHRLDIKYRKVVVLRLVNGYSTKETAEILNIPLGTVLSRLARGQKKLQEMLKPYDLN